MEPKDCNLVFIYNHQKDKNWQEELSKHIPGWHEGKIQPGTDRLIEIKKNMESADIILLLLSSDFFETCDELWQLALKLRETRKISVVPILLRPYSLPKEFEGLQALPRNGKPIAMWDRDHRDEACKDIAKDINSLIERIKIRPQAYLDSPTDLRFVSQKASSYEDKASTPVQPSNLLGEEQPTATSSRREWIVRSGIALIASTLGIGGTLFWTKPKRMESVNIIIVHKSIPSGFTDAPLQIALQDTLGLPVTLEVGKSYADAIERFASKNFNVLWGTDYAYIIARKKCGARVILRKKNRTKDGLKYYSHILTRRSKNINTIKDLTEKNFVFVDWYSTSGYLYPLYAMYKEGLNDSTLLPSYELAGDHEASLRAIISGSHDAGAVSSEFYKSGENLSEIYKNLLTQSNLTDSDIVSIYRSEALSSPPIAVQAEMSEDDIQKLQSAFFLLEDDVNLLGGLSISGFSRATDSMYYSVRDTARALKKMGAEHIEDV